MGSNSWLSTVKSCYFEINLEKGVELLNGLGSRSCGGNVTFESKIHQHCSSRVQQDNTLMSSVLISAAEDHKFLIFAVGFILALILLCAFYFSMKNRCKCCRHGKDSYDMNTVTYGMTYNDQNKHTVRLHN